MPQPNCIIGLYKPVLAQRQNATSVSLLPNCNVKFASVSPCSLACAGIFKLSPDILGRILPVPQKPVGPGEQFSCLWEGVATNRAVGPGESFLEPGGGVHSPPANCLEPSLNDVRGEKGFGGVIGPSRTRE